MKAGSWNQPIEKSLLPSTHSQLSRFHGAGRNPNPLIGQPLLPDRMEAFSPIPPSWTQAAVHATDFCCPQCRATTKVAQQVWVNRRSPVYTEEQRRKWQEFYQCQCSTVWWAWSNDRPPSELADQEREIPPAPPGRLFNPFDDLN
jgi:hypothetical protein